jgi:hypothetical protein
LPRLKTADVATRVTATVGRRAQTPRIPGVTVSQGTPKQRRVTVRFRARVAAVGQARSYAIALVPRDHRRCTLGGLGATIDHDVAAGDRVREDLWIPPDCEGTVDLTVTLHQQRGAPYPTPLPPGRRGDPVVGSTIARLP